ncbi:MAG: hypothetical protein QM737_05180 [Ferruginibacter sp.]
MINYYKKIRSSVLVYLTHKIALPVLKIIRKPEVFPYPIEKLRLFPVDTLGNELYHFLTERNLPLLPHYARHDIKHVVLDYDTTDDGEVCLQCFMLGNRHLSFPVLVTVIFGLITMPEHFQKFRKAFNRGRKSDTISDWKWFEILSVPTVTLKQKIFQQ